MRNIGKIGYSKRGIALESGLCVELRRCAGNFTLESVDRDLKSERGQPHFDAFGEHFLIELQNVVHCADRVRRRRKSVRRGGIAVDCDLGNEFEFCPRIRRGDKEVHVLIRQGVVDELGARADFKFLLRNDSGRILRGRKFCRNAEGIVPCNRLKILDLFRGSVRFHNLIGNFVLVHIAFGDDNFGKVERQTRFKDKIRHVPFYGQRFQRVARLHFDIERIPPFSGHNGKRIILRAGGGKIFGIECGHTFAVLDEEIENLFPGRVQNLNDFGGIKGDRPVKFGQRQGHRSKDGTILFGYGQFARSRRLVSRNVDRFVAHCVLLSVLEQVPCLIVGGRSRQNFEIVPQTVLRGHANRPL